MEKTVTLVDVDMSKIDEYTKKRWSSMMFMSSQPDNYSFFKKLDRIELILKKEEFGSYSLRLFGSNLAEKKDYNQFPNISFTKEKYMIAIAIKRNI